MSLPDLPLPPDTTMPVEIDDDSKVRRLHDEDASQTEYGDDDDDDGDPVVPAAIRLTVPGLTIKVIGPDVAAVGKLLDHELTRKFAGRLERKSPGTPLSRIGLKHALSKAQAQLSDARVLLQRVADGPPTGQWDDAWWHSLVSHIRDHLAESESEPESE